MYKVTTYIRSNHWIILFILLLIPTIYLIIENHGARDLLRRSAPDGQLFYIISRLLGIYAYILLFWQIMLMSFEKLCPPKIIRNHLKRHVIVGSALFVLIVLHSGLFVTAVSMRGGQLSLKPLLPDFSGYYHTAVSLGVFALLFTGLVILTGLFRKKVKTGWKFGHFFTYLVLVLVFIHASMIGSDVQADSLQPLFWSIVAIVSALTVMRIINYKVKIKG